MSLKGSVLVIATIATAIFVTVQAQATLSIWDSDVSANIAAMTDGSHNPYRDFNQLINGYFFKYSHLESLSDLILEKCGPEAGYYLQSYVRDLFFGTLVYWVTAGIWHYVIYNLYGNELFVSKGRAFPSRETIIDQMQLAQFSIFLYAALPILSEFLIESKWTKTYYYIDQVGGWGMYALYFVLYLTLVEIGIYWMHRTLHTNKFLYKYIHALHHKYNSQITMTPWASIAFNPLDGILQASPYVVCLFIVPMHYFTHVFLLFFSGIWATNIHDAVWGDSEPIMGAKYHLIHHTHYHYNFGQFFIFCDYIFGSYKAPQKSKSD